MQFYDQITAFISCNRTADMLQYRQYSTGGAFMFITSVKYLPADGLIKIIIQTKKAGFCAELDTGSGVYPDAFNLEEPFDRKTHVFTIPAEKAVRGAKFTLRLNRKKKGTLRSSFDFICDPVLSDAAAAERISNNGVLVIGSDSETVADGVIYTHYTAEDKNGAPVNMYVLTVDTKKASLYIGTPGDGYANTEVKAKVPEMIDAAVKNGVPVVAAVNADFFDMFGDCHPSGLCVKNGRVIANPDSPRPFIGIKKDGAPVITSTAEEPGIIGELSHAAAGLQMIVKDGKPFDLALLEPFSYTRHPRTAAGVTKDGTVILLVADGRIPEYSNGASLADLAYFMMELGADRALNLDGGGSSIVYTKSADGFELRNVPADLVRPRAMLIRKEFNAILITEKI